MNLWIWFNDEKKRQEVDDKEIIDTKLRENIQCTMILILKIPLIVKRIVTKVAELEHSPLGNFLPLKNNHE